MKISGNRKSNSHNRIIIILGAALAVFAASTAPVHGQEEATGDLENGGRLYSAWDQIVSERQLDGPHPLWPESARDRVSAQVTWRCSTCHGYDYRGNQGGTLNPFLKSEEYPSLLPLSSDPIEEILPWLDGSNNPNHDFSPYLSAQDLLDLSAFLSNGLVAPDLIASSQTREVPGTLIIGVEKFQDFCQSCHGADGGKINFGTTSSPIFLGDLIWTNPWRVAHVMRYGHINTTQPAASKIGLTFSQQIDIMAYLQTFPRATSIADPESQQIDFSTQASTAPMVLFAIGITILVFSAVIITTWRQDSM